MLRPYQTESVSQVAQAFQSGNKRVILCLPTGAGKTVIFSDIASRSAQKGKRVAIITHRRELLSQAGRLNSCDILMVETLNNQIKRGLDLSQYDLLVVDEAHIGNFRKVLEGFNGFVIGATATPISNPPLKEQYNAIVCPVGIESLINDKWLAVPKTYAMHPVDTSKLESARGEYTERSLDDAFNRPKVYEGVVQEFVKNWADKKAIVFCVNISATINTASEFGMQLGADRVFAVHSKQSPQERAALIDQFTASTDGILVNCGIATTGFDCPDIEVVVVNRATKSVALWLQMVGRASRTTPTKSEFTILDFGENVTRLGFWQEPRDWAQLFHNPKKKGEGVAPVKDCEKCGFVAYASARICANCGAEFPKPKKTNEEVLAELKEMQYKVVSKLDGRKLFDIAQNPADLFELQRIKKYKQAFIERVLYFANYTELQRFWRDKGYSDAYKWQKERQFAEGFSMGNFVVKFRKGEK
ncbi:DEAD/DEAH box helicase [Runella sp.]|uniref:DEAD/DEAH box helicase n=1 Tax=Runella sp. TaxID=1960881 RepID=UPI003016973D